MCKRKPKEVHRGLKPCTVKPARSSLRTVYSTPQSSAAVSYTTDMRVGNTVWVDKQGACLSNKGMYIVHVN